MFNKNDWPSIVATVLVESHGVAVVATFLVESHGVAVVATVLAQKGDILHQCLDHIVFERYMFGSVCAEGIFSMRNLCCICWFTIKCAQCTLI